MEMLIFVRKLIFEAGKSLPIHIIPKHIKVPKIDIFSTVSDIF